MTMAGIRGRTLVAAVCGLLLAQTASAAFGVCYMPDGTDVQKNTKDNYFRCSETSSDQTMCCNESHGDVCTPDGLCWKKEDPPDKLWRTSCSDPTWKADGCLKLCIKGNTSEYSFFIRTWIGFGTDCAIA
jgi:hypothetical protein